ncbi:MAG: hypothetical protein AAB515_04040 [Patescibacteria group bacterium]
MGKREKLRMQFQREQTKRLMLQWRRLLKILVVGFVVTALASLILFIQPLRDFAFGWVPQDERLRTVGVIAFFVSILRIFCVVFFIHLFAKRYPAMQGLHKIFQAHQRNEKRFRFTAPPIWQCFVSLNPMEVTTGYEQKLQREAEIFNEYHTSQVRDVKKYVAQLDRAWQLAAKAKSHFDQHVPPEIARCLEVAIDRTTSLTERQNALEDIERLLQNREKKSLIHVQHSLDAELKDLLAQAAEAQKILSGNRLVAFNAQMSLYEEQRTLAPKRLSKQIYFIRKALSLAKSHVLA